MGLVNPIQSGQVCASCEQAIRHGSGQLANVPGLIIRILEEDLWRERRAANGKIVRLKSFIQLITKKPYEGWGESAKHVKALLKGNDKALALWAKATTASRGRPSTENSDIVTIKPQRGNSKADTDRRLAEQRPDLFAQVTSGTLSTNAAAIKAGWRKKKTPLEQLLHWWKKADSMERQTFLREVT